MIATSPHTVSSGQSPSPAALRSAAANPSDPDSPHSVLIQREMRRGFRCYNKNAASQFVAESNRLGATQADQASSGIRLIRLIPLTLTFYRSGPIIHLECLLKRKRSGSNCCKGRSTC